MASALCLTGTGLDEATLNEVETEITAEQELRLIRNVVNALPKTEGLALEAGKRYQLTDFGIWGYALFSSRNLREALRLALRYLDLSFIFGELIFEESASSARLHFDYSMIPADIRQFLIERDLIAIQVVARLVFPKSQPLIGMEFGFPKPVYADRLAKSLGFMPKFGTKDTRCVFNLDVLDQPLPQANTATARMCEIECQKLLTRRRARSGVSAKVRDIILRQPARTVNMETVAAELCLTARTLRRHLADEGSSFRGLRDEVLQMLAEELIDTAHMKLSEVAERLGYADAAAFSHAFKRWRGVTPGATRIN
ncbi:MAG: AraC family transcriptional regulator [Stenotrophobium sp.]